MTLAALLSELHNTSPAWAARFPKPEPRSEVHGTMAAYRTGCRCAICRAAKSANNREWRAKLRKR